MLFEEVKTNLQNAIEHVETSALQERGAVFFGTQPTRVGMNPKFYIPSTTELYKAQTAGNTAFANMKWEAILNMIFENVWPMELNYFAMTWEERKALVVDHRSMSMQRRR
eukprot:2988319-Amphidinium_carterae.1